MCQNSLILVVWWQHIKVDTLYDANSQKTNGTKHVLHSF